MPRESETGFVWRAVGVLDGRGASPERAIQVGWGIAGGIDGGVQGAEIGNAVLGEDDTGNQQDAGGVIVSF